ncbi:MAG: sulfotransferase family protein [Elainellaceae cyanobacterium]
MRKPAMKLPNFLIIGVQKAGTTSVYHYLKQHPQIYMSPVKETNFLERDWESVDPAIRAQVNQERVRQGRLERIDTFEKYRDLFNVVTDEIAIGEASPNYLFHYPSSSRLIQHYVPQAKLIAILRNPVDRAYSDYLMHVREAINVKESLTEQIRRFPEHQSFTLKKGFYYEPLSHYFNVFDPHQIKVYLYDDLCHDPLAMMQNLYQFLGVDSTFVADTSKREQVAQVPKSSLMNQVLRTRNPMRSVAASALKLIVPVDTRQYLRDRLIQINSAEKSKAQPLSTEARHNLLNIYRDDILNLQDLIQRDLSVWLA